MIIKSLLDLDIYKFLMMQVANDTFPSTEVSYFFKNRTQKIVLKDWIAKEDLEREIKNVQSLSFKDYEIDYLKSLNQFSATFLNRLKSLKLSNVNISYDNKEIEITTRGKWVDTILWETIILSIVNELFYRAYLKSEKLSELEVIKQGKAILFDKMSLLIKRDDIIFSDFGTRRRFSADWQKNVLSILHNNLDRKSFIGTSNVYYAMLLGLKPIGTQAHEYYMIGSGIFDQNTDETLRDSHSKMLDIWFKTYGYDKSIALSDTFGTDFFLEDFAKFAKNWKGVRHDSGDPFKFGDKIINYYKDLNINPLDKVIVFSDGLTVDLMIKLQDYFKGRIQISFGIGTNLTNDMDKNWPTLSIVMKADAIFKLGNRFNLVKLSDNLNKATGEEVSIERYKRVYGYTNTSSQILKV